VTSSPLVGCFVLAPFTKVAITSSAMEMVHQNRSVIAEKIIFSGG